MSAEDAPSNRVIRIVLLVMVVGAMLFVAMQVAWAHSLYEPGCCSDRDCAPVADGKVVEKSDGVHVEGFGILHRTDPRIRWSRDDRDHVCANASRKLLCVYLRPSGT